MAGYITGMVIGSIVIAIGITLAILSNIKNRSFKKLVKSIGQKAEDKINADIKVWAKYTKNHFIHSALFSYGQDKVFEVDSILITDKAIIVIEIKSIRGGIKGDAKEPKWNKVLGDKTFPISNPIIQNDKHIKHIINMSSIKVPTISLIVFSNRTEYISVTNTPGHAVITREVDLFNTLDKINATLDQKLTVDETKEIYKTLKRFRTNSRKDVELHKRITGQIGGK